MPSCLGKLSHTIALRHGHHAPFKTSTAKECRLTPRKCSLISGGNSYAIAEYFAEFGWELNTRLVLVAFDIHLQ